MSEYLSAAARALDAPEAIVQRSAEARAKASGQTADDVLKAWAGGESVATAAPATDAPAPEPEAAPEPAAVPEPAPTEPEPAAAPAAEPAPAAAAPPAAVTAPPAPERVGPEEALDHPVVVSVPTAGLKERTTSSIPRWLAAVFVLVPAFGLLYMAGNIGPEATACSEGGITLAVDRVTGALENCDGSEFTGRGGAGGGAGEFLVLGEETYAQCASCHGANGGGGVGPAFSGVLRTFGSCQDHMEWVSLGSAGFQAAGRDTYGDLATPIGGGMPGFAQLTEEQLASVVSFERIRFGGGDPTDVLTDCGLLQGEEPADGGDTTGTTAAPEAGAAVGRG